MVLVSGAVFSLSAGDREIRVLEYLKKRIPRLVAPTWMFLFIFFLFSSLLLAGAGRDAPFTVKTVLASFFLFSGIAYIWIVRVFLLVALGAPFFLSLHRRLSSHWFYFAAVLVIYAVYELLWALYFRFGAGPFAYFVEHFLLYILPYGCVFAVGLRLPVLNRRAVGLMCGLLFLMFSIVVFGGSYSTKFVATQFFKYPPTFYYLSYSLLASFALFLFLSDKGVSRFFSSSFLTFVSTSSLWIYLWHILLLYCWDWFLSNAPAYYLTKFMVIFLLSAFLTYIQKRMVNTLIMRMHLRPNIKNLLTLIFLN
jgi:peptidoglycan/LPS O-acetylase OafA/YrhL